ncbi:hypothetical protein BJ741DRAFT_438696 [Chytriomyces cf. hyalinus JEL632]|nr:hypothetical protein BJ741DRAFT_438696 [Chytriomyces cf. hyalinus JEL632]
MLVKARKSLSSFSTTQSAPETAHAAKFLVTQPRRISALGLSDRVSSERAEPVGDSVGYHIRLENRMSAKTRILFCTTGILLRRMEEGPGRRVCGWWN